MCFGPYGFNNKMNELDTVKQFQNIINIAQEIFFQEFHEKLATEPISLDQNQEDRLLSAVINNQAVLKYLSLTDKTPRENRDKQLLQIHSMFNESAKLSKHLNTVA